MTFKSIHSFFFFLHTNDLFLHLSYFLHPTLPMSTFASSLYQIDSLNDLKHNFSMVWTYVLKICFKIRILEIKKARKKADGAILCDYFERGEWIAEVYSFHSIWRMCAYVCAIQCAYVCATKQLVCGTNWIRRRRNESSPNQPHVLQTYSLAKLS